MNPRAIKLNIGELNFRSHNFHRVKPQDYKTGFVNWPVGIMTAFIRLCPRLAVSTIDSKSVNSRRRMRLTRGDGSATTKLINQQFSSCFRYY